MLDLIRRLIWDPATAAAMADLREAATRRHLIDLADHAPELTGTHVAVRASAVLGRWLRPADRQALNSLCAARSLSCPDLKLEEAALQRLLSATSR